MKLVKIPCFWGSFWLTSTFFKHLGLKTTTPIDFSALVYSIKVPSFVAQVRKKPIVRNITMFLVNIVKFWKMSFLRVWTTNEDIFV